MRWRLTLAMCLVATTAHAAADLNSLTTTLVGKPVATPAVTDHVLTVVGGQIKRSTVSEVVGAAVTGGTITPYEVQTTAPDGQRGVECTNTGDFSTTQPRTLTTADAGLYCFNRTLGKYRAWNGSQIVDLGDLVGIAAAPPPPDVTLDSITDWPTGVTSPEVGFLDGVTGPIQDQIDALTTGSSDRVAAPTFSNSACVTGQWADDGQYHYRCKATNTWDRYAVTYAGWTNLADTTPEAFAGFAAKTDVALNTLVTSDAVSISGINAPAAISVAGGSYAINGGSFTTAAGTITSGQTVTAQHTSAATNSTATTTTVTIGGVPGAFTSTTLAAVQSCTYPVKDQQTSTASAYTLTDGTRKSLASSFTASASYSLERVGVSMFIEGSPAAAIITAKIYSDNAGAPGTPLYTSSSTVSSSTLTTTPAMAYWNFAAASLTSGTMYHLVLSSDINTTATDRIRTRGTSTGAASGYTVRSGVEGVWASPSTSDAQINFTASSCN